LKGILILAHGSRERDTEATLNKVVSILKERVQFENIEQAYMEFSEPNINKGLSKLVADGVTDIKVVPYFLFEGVHIKEDIPKEIREFNEANPQVKITIGKTLGADSRLAEILADRVKEVI
jgi:sirohydrochlorin ferrochelatase